MVHRVPAVEAHSDGTDERVLIEAAQRDPIRFAELYERNFGRVYTFIARRTRERGEAEDLTAEVFQRALANLERFEWRGVPLWVWLLAPLEGPPLALLHEGASNLLEMPR